MGQTETVTLGGGCFWCLEAVFQRMQGLRAVEPGYMGGTLPKPTYAQVCSGTTGHAEVVRLTFDPGISSFRDVLEVFFAIHDPTTRDRQGNDAGPQYRSVIFYESDTQRATAEEVIRELEQRGVWGAPIVTEVRPATTFYPAEEYHWNYFRNHSEKPYCAFVIAPKLGKFREKFGSKARGAGGH